MSSDELLVEVREGVAYLTFNRPRARNAMNPAMRDAFFSSLKTMAEDDQVSVLVLRGAGNSFIAGGDLESFAETLQLDRDSRRQNYRDRVNVAAGLVRVLHDFDKPVVALIEGNVAGAGISIALCCDYIMATANARFNFSHVHLGLALDLGLSYFLPRQVGTLQARRLAMLGARVEAAEALELGLVTSVVQTESVEKELEILLATLKKMPITALSAIKDEFRTTWNATLDEQLCCESEKVAACAATESFEQRLAALVGRSEP